MELGPESLLRSFEFICSRRKSVRVSLEIRTAIISCISTLGVFDCMHRFVSVRVVYV